MSYDPSHRSHREEWHPSRLITWLVVLALLILPALFFGWQQRTSQARLQAMAVERAAQADQARAAYQTLLLQSRNQEGAAPVSDPGDPASVAELRREVDRLKARVAELEARVPAFPNPAQSEAVRHEGSLTLPASPD